MKVLSVVGNRPQFVKSAPLSVALRDRGIEEIVLHTGQHYDSELSQVFFDELGLPEPGYRLDLHTAEPAPMRAGIRKAIAAESPDLVLVFGDTNSTLAGALAANDTGVRQAHVEAGLRSGDLEMPEERNRIEVDRLAAILFAPDDQAAETLAGEGVPGRREVVGDVMLDATLQLAPVAARRSHVLDALDLEPRAYVVTTVHREANAVPNRLEQILEGLSRVDEPVVFAVHPRTRKTLDHAGLEAPANVRLLRPLGYLDFTALASQARVIATDSGGLQKEAYWHGVPCVTLRDTTEWTETVNVGANTLAGDDPDAIAEAVTSARMPAERPHLYGDGHASERIAEVLVTLSP
ncbi:MAG: UDP-N-acetylglucosamine 2-epimerase (non-hydrolyzing) [Actinobacteria bacterium]|nr:MAG: UDP-N-acetylglucosamine 2-epimerase (non-hydrolyzing) [Actinomycetota bacterium]